LPTAQTSAILRRNKREPGVPDTYDYIVTGAGSAGCVLAARLTESGRYKVLLLEAGGKDSNPWIHVPMGYAKTFVDPKVNWKFESEPEKELNGRTMYQPRGKVLGGTSSINGMIDLHARQRRRLRPMASTR
jgi:choline dehydrogenase